ncbi:hypothetical protein B0H13DRAFT_1730930 [Mycena leptocephala]|nr:hypothetical protein B0H13DRAFT_1730930 [Mycena leptocephala]
MKRTVPSSNENPPPKRSKASQACASCRRQKSRCEILDVRPAPGAPVTIRCHRCKVLGVQCSFETSDLIHFAPKTTSQTPPDASAASSGERMTFNSIPGQFGMSPEDLVPTPTTPIWGSVSRVDWTATPMLAIQELVRLSDILSPPEITSLLEMFVYYPLLHPTPLTLMRRFENRYTPWLCAQPGPLESSNSLLNIARCTIASRHLSPDARATIAPRLQKLTEDVFLREIFNPQPSLESIKALLILSVWTPICGTGAETQDGRLLIASAVSMAMNLHLQNESKRAVGLRADKDGLTSDKQAELNESTQRWRLWMHLSISESMLCLGTGRTPVSHFSQLDREMINLSSLPHFTLSAVRDIRLGLGAKLFDITETALKFRLKTVADLGAFFDQINASISSMEGLSRLFVPLPVITQYDSFYSQMLLLQYNCCRLLIIHHALREARTAYEREKPLTPWYAAEIKGHHISLYWGHQALISAEAVLTTFLTPSDLTLLSTAPDNLYVMIGFAATWIFVSNFSLLHLGKGQVGGASERLQSMTIERLKQIAHSPDHAAARCGHVLGALMNAWEQRKPQEGTPHTNGLCMMHNMHFTPFPLPDVASADGYLNPPSYQDLADTSNSDLFMDDAFWASFVENLNSDTFIAQNSVAT